MKTGSSVSQGRRANSIHMLAGQLMSKGAVFLAMMMLSRYLDDVWFGRLLFALALSLFSFFITDFGTAILVNRSMSLADMKHSLELWRSALGFRTVTGFIAVAVITLFSFLSFPESQTLLLLPVLLGMTLEIYSELPFAIFRASGATRFESRARFLSSLVFLVAAAVMILLRLHPMAVASAFLLRGVALAVSGFSACGFLGFPFRPAFHGRHLLRLFREAWPLGVMGFLTVMHQRVDNLVIEGRLGVVSVGAYNEIYKVVEVLVLVVTPTLLPGSLFPGLCKAFEAGRREARLEMRRTAILIAVLSASVTALVLPPGQPFMRLLWGGAYLRGVSPGEFDSARLILLSAIPVYYFMNFLMSALIASGRQRATLPAVFAGFAVSLVLNLLLVGLLGLPGAAVAAMASNLVIAAVCWAFLGRSAGLGMILPMILGSLPAAAVPVLSGVLPWPAVSAAALVCVLPAFMLWRTCLRGGVSCPGLKRNHPPL